MNFNEESFIYRIMGIDNGSSSLGMVIMDLNLRTGSFQYIESSTLVAERLLSNHRGVVVTHGARWARECTLRDNLVELLDFHQPHAVAVETPFFMPRRVQSFETLTEMMIFIRLAMERYNPCSDIYPVTPGEAKRAVQPKDAFTMKKAVIRDCVLALDCIVYPEGFDADSLSEHEFDAIAVAIAHGKAVRKWMRFQG